MDHTKMLQANLNFPRQELSVRCLEFAIALLFVGNLICCVCLLRIQSRCRIYGQKWSGDFWLCPIDKLAAGSLVGVVVGRIANNVTHKLGACAK